MSDLALLLLVVLAILIIVRGPKVLPRLGASFGRGLRDVRRAAREAFDGDEPDDPTRRTEPRET